jgi:hypothetical protein
MDKLFNRDVDCKINSGSKSPVEHFCDEFNLPNQGCHENKTTFNNFMQNIFASIENILTSHSG